jgi:radical SAM superfamily enzyme YgiQ (UPF0313 family)
MLCGGEIREVIGTVNSDVASALSCTEADPDIPADIRSNLQRACAMDYAALEKDAWLLRHIYLPVTILPPDQYLSVVLQATEGCHYNRCSFCGFYRDRTFRIKPLAEFKRHVSRVREFLADGITLRRRVFLADANALCIPRDRLLPLLDLIPDAGFLEGINSFVDVFTRSRAGAEYRELRARNVRTLYLGVESGCRELLRFVRKPQEPEETLDAIRAIKAGGLDIGVLIMLGIGGRLYNKRHVEETVALLNSVPWGGRDTVFLSEFVEFPDLEYPELARSAGIEPLSAEELAAQRDAIREGIRCGSSRPRIAPYNAGDFLY